MNNIITDSVKVLFVNACFIVIYGTLKYFSCMPFICDFLCRYIGRNSGWNQSQKDALKFWEESLQKPRAEN